MVWAWIKWLVPFFHQSIPKKAMLILRKEALTGYFGARTVRKQWDFSGLKWRLIQKQALPWLSLSPAAGCLPLLQLGLSFMTDHSLRLLQPSGLSWGRLNSCLSGSPVPFTLVTKA